MFSETDLFMSKSINISFNLVLKHCKRFNRIVWSSLIHSYEGYEIWSSLNPNLKYILPWENLLSA
jgi:hypothetical protein